MDRDDLIEYVLELDRRVGESMTALEAVTQKRKAMATTLEDLADRVDDLEAENECLRTRLDAVDTTGKVSGLVQYAHNKRSDQDVVHLDTEEIRGAYGCSERWAYQLCDDLPERYDWIFPRGRVPQYGDRQIDKDSQTKGIAIDFEGVHSSGCPLNRFINDPDGEDSP